MEKVSQKRKSIEKFGLIFEYSGKIEIAATGS
jgi:hypothetical protein